MVEPHLFIFLGSDELEKQKRIEALQKKFFPPSLKDINYNVLYGSEKQLTPLELKEALSCLPTEGAAKRLVIIRQAHKLNQANQKLLLKELGRFKEKLCVVLDVGEVKGSEDFVKEFIKIGAQLVRFKSDVAANVFDLGRAIVSRRPEAALKILSGLFQYRQEGEKILGAIFWQWEHSFTGKRLSQDAYQKGLKLILEADKKLKSSYSAIARQNLILEALVVKLVYLT